MQPVFHLQGNTVCLEGVTVPPVRLWELPARLESARQNVRRSIPGVAPALFVGIEHLLHLDAQWDPRRPVVIVEKCAAYARWFLLQHRLEPPQTPAQILLCGEHGVQSPLRHAEYDPVFFFQEMGHVALAMMQLPDTWFSPLEIWTLPEHATEQAYFDHFHRMLYAVVEAKRFHAGRASAYAAFRDRAVSEQPCLLIRDAAPSNKALQFLRDILPVRHARVFAVGDYGDPINFAFPFGRHPVAREALWQEPARQWLQPYRDNAERWFQFLVEAPPPYVAYLNRSPFCTLEDVLFLEEGLRRLRVPVKAVFSEPFCLQANALQGGWSYELFDRYGDVERTTVYTFDAFSASSVGPRALSTVLYPLSDLVRVGAVVPPDGSTRFERDIAIVHASRSLALAAPPALHELFDCVIQHSPLELGTAIHRFLAMMRHRLEQSGEASLFQKTLWHYIDHTWLPFIRVRRVKQLIARLHQEYRIEVFGDGWQGLVPAVCCRGVVSREQVAEVYRQSTVTINCNPVQSVTAFHVNVVECLAAGGLPLLYMPSIDLAGHPAVPFFSTEQQYYFGNEVELRGYLERFCRNPAQRLEAVAAAQQGWLHDVQKRHRSGTTPPPVIPLHRTDYAAQSITSNPTLDRALIDVGVGYMCWFVGYGAKALHYWDQALAQWPHPYAPLLERVEQVRREISL